MTKTLTSLISGLLTLLFSITTSFASFFADFWSSLDIYDFEAFLFKYSILVDIISSVFSGLICALIIHYVSERHSKKRTFHKRHMKILYKKK